MDTTFVNGTTLSDADWFNDVNRLHYSIFQDPPDLAAVKALLGIGGGIFTGPVSFADGSISAPSISFTSRASSGISFNTTEGLNFSESAVKMLNINSVSASVYGQLNVSGNIYAPGGRFDINHIVLPNTGRIYLNDGAGVPRTAISTNNVSRLNIGEGAWGDMLIFGGSGYKIHVHDGGVAFVGSITGISAAMVGLGNVMNNQQVYNVVPGNGLLGMYWTGGTVNLQIGGTDQGAEWPINVTGRSRSMYTPEGVNLTFNWATVGGTPSWILAGVGDGNFRIYSPSTMTVGNANTVGGIGPWNWSDRGHNPVYLWANDGGTNDQFLATPGILSVNYANTANYANSAGYASSAGGISSINGASGGTVNGTIKALLDGNIGGFTPGEVWQVGQFIAQSSGSAYPIIGLHRSGVIAWDIVVSYTNSLWFGASNNNGMSAYNYHSFVIDGNAQVHAGGYNTNTFLRSNVQPLTGAVFNVLTVQGVRCYNEELKRTVLTVDIDVETFPELVRDIRSEAGEVKGQAVNQMGLIGPIIEAIRELNNRLTALESA